MPDTPRVITLSPRDYDAILFDLDGVLTKTARVHAAAWKRLFDQFLEQRSAETGEPFVRVDVDNDYRRHVDGKPRQDGVVAFLQSRRIDLPLGAPDDGPNVRTVHGLGNLKDQYFLEELHQQGVERYETSIELVRTLRAEDVKTGVVSSSNNCAAVLAAAEIADLFDVRVDGLDIARLVLNGKPAPDGFLEAARRLGLEPTRVVVVEDAIAGVQAGRAGGFGLVIGVDRGGQSLELRRAGADVVVAALAEIRVARASPSTWSLVFDDFDPGREGIREVSMHDMHLAALEVSVTPENWSGRVTIRSAIDGRIVNAGAHLYRQFNNIHLVPVTSEATGPNTVCLLVRTSQSNIHVAEAARTEVILEGQPVEIQRRSVEEPGYIAQELTVDVAQGQTLSVEKVVAFYTSRDHAIAEPAREARTTVARAGRFDDLMAAHVRAWKHLWRRFDVHIEPAQPGKLNVLMLLRLNMCHLLQTVSPHSIGLDIGVPARGWTGEAYQGHVFWDELFIFPFFNHRMPEITRALLLYRHRRLGEARAAARRAGYQGAMFPWQSGSNGEAVTQVHNLNARSGRWVPDHSSLQRHVGSAIAYNVWQYFQVTQDLEFLEFYGAELILEIARFWSSIAQCDEARGRYEIRGVIGPDEYHDGDPDVSTPGLANNAYTNVMAVWVLWRARDVLKLLSGMRRAELTASLGLTSEEIARWDTISRRMFVPLQGDGVISQCEGYEALREFDWDAYRTRIGTDPSGIQERSA